MTSWSSIKEDTN